MKTLICVVHELWCRAGISGVRRQFLEPCALRFFADRCLSSLTISHSEVSINSRSIPLALILVRASARFASPCTHLVLVLFSSVFLR